MPGAVEVPSVSPLAGRRRWGTEELEIHAKCFKDQSHLNAIVSEAEGLVNDALTSSDPRHRR
jgi:hypothetical protein